MLADTVQADVFLEPQIYGGIKRFGIDMVGTTTIANYGLFFIYNLKRG